MKIEIRKGSIEDTVQIMQGLPEFQSPYNLLEVKNRIEKVPHLNLIATADDVLSGFKLGYERDGYFYSWLGGVLPKYRRHGIAQMLADEQEKWTKRNGYKTITFKTRNCHKAMLRFSLKNGFDIFRIEEKESIEEYRIWLRKRLA